MSMSKKLTRTEGEYHANSMWPLKKTIIHMKANEVLITQTDKQRLLNVLISKSTSELDLTENLKLVKKKMDTAVVVNSKEVPPQVVTMNSTVIVKNLSFGSTARLTLVYPDERSALDYKVSVFSPLGAAILGYSQGDVIEWDGKQATTKFLIEKIIYQPESAGDYHL